MVVRRARRKYERAPREMWERGTEKALWPGGGGGLAPDVCCGCGGDGERHSH